MAETRILKEVSYFEFREIIEKYGNQIKVNSHAYFRLGEQQRKVYKDEGIVQMLTEEKPAFIGIQQNQNYAAFFSKKQSYIRLMFKVTKSGIDIVTFYTTDHIPQI